MGFSLGDLFGTSKYERNISNLSNMYGGQAKKYLPGGMADLFGIAHAPGLTPGMQQEKSVYDSDLLSGYNRALDDLLRGNKERGMGTSLLDMGSRAAAGRSYAGDRARNAASMTRMSEQDKRQALLQLLQMASGAGQTAIGGNQAAGQAAMSPWDTLFQLGGMFNV